MIRSDSVLRPIGAVSALLAAIASSALLAIHAAPEVAGLAGLCGGEGLGCRSAVASPWAVLPPRVGPLAGEGWRPPAAGLALVHFTLVGAWVLFVGRRGALLRGAVAIGFAVSIAFLLLLLTVVETPCGLCLATHAANALLTAAVLAPSSGPATTTPLLQRAAALVAGLALAGCGWLGAQWLGTWRSLAITNEQLAGLGELDELYDQVWLRDERFTASPAARDRFDAWIRDDDPHLGPAPSEARAVLVVFTDLECPSCRDFDRSLEREVLPHFDGGLSVVFKALPLTRLHPNAEPAARALEAARLQGRYFELRSDLLAPGLDLGSVDWSALAADSGLDADRFERDRASAAVGERLAFDRRAATALGVESTPTLFLDRREVPPAARSLAGFWRRRAGADR